MADVDNVVRFGSAQSRFDKEQKSSKNIRQIKQVQLRLSLDNIDRTARDLQLLQDAVERARRITAQAIKLRDPALLEAVRKVFEEANRHLGAYQRGQKSSPSNGLRES